MVKEILDGGQANKVFGTLEQLLTDEEKSLDTVFSALNAAAKKAFDEMPVPEATDATTTVALLREFEKLVPRKKSSVKGKPTGGERAGKRAKFDTDADASSSKLCSQPDPVAGPTATSSKPTLRGCLLGAGLSDARIEKLQPEIDSYGIQTVSDLKELYMHGVPDPDLTSVIGFTKIEAKRLMNRTGRIGSD